MGVLKATALFTLGDLKDWLKVPDEEPKFDGLIADIGNWVTEDLESKTGRIYVSRTVTETLNWDGGDRVLLSRYPVVGALTTFTIDGTAVAVDNFALDGSAGLIWMKNWTSAVGVQNVALAYTAGYALADVPMKASMVAREMAKIIWDQWNAGTISANTITLGAASVNVRADWPWHIKRAFDELSWEIRPI